MTNALNVKPALGAAIHAIAPRWGWFVALGVGELILGGVASTNLLAASLASVLVIGAAIAVAGLIQIFHAFSARGPGGVLLWLLAGVVYATAGAIILYDPIFASLTSSLTAGVFITIYRIIRVLAGLHARPAAGWAG